MFFVQCLHILELRKQCLSLVCCKAVDLKPLDDCTLADESVPALTDVSLHHLELGFALHDLHLTRSRPGCRSRDAYF